MPPTRKCLYPHSAHRLYFGERDGEREGDPHKKNGEDYEGAVYVPYLANIPDGRATLILTLQNINFTKTAWNMR